MTTAPVDLEAILDNAIAHHEAAHAVATWLFGYGRGIEFIDMTGTQDADGPGECFISRRAIRDPYHYTREYVLMEMMVSLIGPAAGQRIKQCDDVEWLEFLLECSDDPNFGGGPGSDIDQVINREINYLFLSDRRKWSTIYRIGRWCDELVADPKVWHVITTLATTLKNTTGRLSGQEAVSIMETAWQTQGMKPEGIPIDQLGRKWQRRFQPE